MPGCWTNREDRTTCKASFGSAIPRPRFFVAETQIITARDARLLSALLVSSRLNIDRTPQLNLGALVRPTCMPPPCTGIRKCMVCYQATNVAHVPPTVHMQHQVVAATHSPLPSHHHHVDTIALQSLYSSCKSSVSCNT
jgi:hypothetical protein